MIIQFDQQLLQDDLNSLLHWNKLVTPSFDPTNVFTYVLIPKLFNHIFLFIILYPPDQFKVIWD